MTRRAWALTDTQRFLFISILIGLAAGLVIVCFHVAIELTSWAALGTPPGARRVATAIVPAAGALAAWLLVRHVWPAAGGSGVNNTRAALYVSDGAVPFSSVVGKFSACTIAIGSGNPLGPEDPALQMGAGLASALGRAFRLDRERMRLIAPVGAAAGIAAAFNTPITGVIFVIEEVLAGWNAGVLGSIVLAAVSAVVVTRAFLGDAVLFSVPAFTLTHPSELFVYAAVGLIGGLVGATYIRSLTGLRARLRRVPAALRAIAVCGAGLTTGVVALALPQVLGTGYPAIDGALHDEFPWRLLLVLGLVRTGLTTLSFASGTPGGLFAPTLFVGAMIGGGLGGLAHEYWPVPTSAASSYVLVGMGTLFAAVFRAPMTSIFMVFEVSATYAIILPVMVANTLAWLVSRQIAPRGIFEVVAEQDGQSLPSTEEQRERRIRRVEDVMTGVASLTIVGPHLTVADVRGRACERGSGPCLVQMDGRAWALVEPAALASPDDIADDSREVRALAALTRLPVLHPDEPIEAALRMLATRPAAAVVCRTRPPRLLGLVTMDGLLAAFAASPAPAEPAAAR